MNLQETIQLLRERCERPARTHVTHGHGHSDYENHVNLTDIERWAVIDLCKYIQEHELLPSSPQCPKCKRYNVADRSDVQGNHARFMCRDCEHAWDPPERKSVNEAGQTWIDD